MAEAFERGLDRARARGADMIALHPYATIMLGRLDDHLGRVAAKEGIVGQWRSLSQKAHAAGADPSLKEQLTALTKKVEDADAKIREAAKPQKLRFELASQ